jgi:hypothetical protein
VLITRARGKETTAAPTDRQAAATVASALLSVMSLANSAVTM